MPDENSDIQNQNTEEVEGTEDEQVTNDEQSVDYEAQYKELQPEFTRRSQELTEYHELFEALQDPERQLEALRRLGIEAELEDNNEEDLYVDPQDKLEERLSAIEAREQQAEQQREEQAQIDREVEHLGNQLAEIERSTGRKFTDEEAELYGHVAASFRDERGMPDAKQAHEFIEGITKQRFEDYKQSKRVGQPQSGVPSTKGLDLSTPDARARYMAERVKATKQAV